MTPSHLPKDPFAAHEQVMQRAEQVLEQRREERRKPLPEKAVAEITVQRGLAMARIQAEVLDVSATGMRLAAFANEQIQQGDRCTISVQDSDHCEPRAATVRWVKPHPLIQVFGVQFDPQHTS